MVFKNCILKVSFNYNWMLMLPKNIVISKSFSNIALIKHVKKNNNSVKIIYWMEQENAA